MDIIDNTVEFLEKLLFLLIDVLILLVENFVLPLDVCIFMLGLNDQLLLLGEHFAHAIILTAQF